MFQFTGLPPYDYGFIIRYTESVCVGCPIRRSPDQRVFAPPRSFSQLVTSFIGSQCQGIRPAPFMLDRITVALPVIALTGSLMNCFFSVSPGNEDTADRNFRFRPESSHFCDSSDVFLILCLLRLDVFTSQAVYRSHLAPSCAAYRITGARSVGVPPTCLYTSCRTHVNMLRHAV